jgi:hypothetical protein
MHTDIATATTRNRSEKPATAKLLMGRYAYVQAYAMVASWKTVLIHKSKFGSKKDLGLEHINAIR